MRPNLPPGPRPPVIARCLSGSAFSENRVLSEVDALGQRSTILHRWTNWKKVTKKRRFFGARMKTPPADAYLYSTRHVCGQDYLPHPKLIVVWSIQVYAIVLEVGPGES